MTTDTPIGHIDARGRLLVQTLDPETGERDKEYFPASKLIELGHGKTHVTQIEVNVQWVNLNRDIA